MYFGIDLPSDVPHSIQDRAYIPHLVHTLMIQSWAKQPMVQFLMIGGVLTALWWLLIAPESQIPGESMYRPGTLSALYNFGPGTSTSASGVLPRYAER